LVLGLLVLLGFIFAEMGATHRDATFGLSEIIRVLILICPLAYLSITRGLSLDSRAFQRRWTGLGVTHGVFSAPPGVTTNTSPEATLLDLAYRPEVYTGRQVAVIGMIHHDAKMQERFGINSIVLYRFAISCCAADAMPAAILLVGGDLADWPDDTWIQAEGRFLLKPDKDQKAPTLELHTATQIKKPRRPYLY
ncbi:MAG: hypothetical protein V2A34_03440, partial [Lentisphaerota bacterium]